MRGTPEEPGITLLAVRDIFNHIGSTQDREFLLRVSYMEVRTHPGCNLRLTADRRTQDVLPLSIFNFVQWFGGLVQSTLTA